MKKAQDIILRPIITEASMSGIANKKYTFKVANDANKIEIAKAVSFNAKVIIMDEPTGALDSKNARALMEKLSGLNADAGTTILMVTHDCNAASYCKRILFIQDGVLFHELRRDVPDETQQAFYGRILSVMAQLGGGSANVL